MRSNHAPIRTAGTRRIRPLAALVAFGVLSLAFAASPGRARAASEDRPNILVLLADDVGWNDFGCYGSEWVRTPNIDALAAGGLRCERAFLTTPQCSPTRISVLTGRYPHATGAEDLHMPLPEGTEILPSFLRRAGYFSASMLKTHYGPHGQAQFDRHGKDLAEFPALLDAAGDAPFFVWIGFRDAHREFTADDIPEPHDPAKVVVPPWMADAPGTRRDLASYANEIARMDGDIGRLVEELERRGELANTLIVFFSDNGAPFPRAKGAAYDSGVRTPLIFHWPDRVAPGGVHAGIASVVDLAPTLLEAAGLSPEPQFQGASMLARVLDPSKPGREFAFSERNWHNCDEHIRTVRGERFRLIRNAYLDLPYGNPADVGASPSFKDLARLREAGHLNAAQRPPFAVPRPRLELYDTVADPHELENLADRPEHAETVAALERELDRWIAETGDFPPERRRRPDNTDRFSGDKHTGEIEDFLPEN